MIGCDHFIDAAVRQVILLTITALPGTAAIELGDSREETVTDGAATVKVTVTWSQQKQ